MEWDDEDAADLKRAALIGNLNSLFIVGKLIGYSADIVRGKPWARKGTNSHTPVFDNANDFSYGLGKIIKEWNENPNALEEDLIYELAQGAGIDAMDFFGLPAGRVESVYQSVSGASNKWDEYTDAQKTALIAGYSKWLVENKGKTNEPTKVRKKRTKKAVKKERK
jgi:hypothetical protein